MTHSSSYFNNLKLFTGTWQLNKVLWVIKFLIKIWSLDFICICVVEIAIGFLKNTAPVSHKTCMNKKIFFNSISKRWITSTNWWIRSTLAIKSDEFKKISFYCLLVCLLFFLIYITLFKCFVMWRNLNKCQLSPSRIDWIHSNKVNKIHPKVVFTIDKSLCTMPLNMQTHVQVDAISFYSKFVD